MRQAIVHVIQETRAADRFPPRAPPVSVENKVREVVHAWNLGIPKEQIERRLLTACHLCCSSYQHTSLDFQIAMSLFTVGIVIIDDGLISAQALREFGPRLFTRELQMEPSLNRLLERAKDVCAYLPDYGTHRFLAGILTFANEELWFSGDGKDLAIHAMSGKYIEYSRWASGVPEPYAFGIWPTYICPDITEYVQAIP